MLDYLNGSLLWLRKRAYLLLEALQTDLSESIRSRIEEQIVELNITIQEISDRIEDPTLSMASYIGQHLPDFRYWVRTIDEIETIFLPLVERWQADEEALQQLCKRICSECNLPPTINPITALYSPEYFFVMLNGLDVIYLPRLEGKFLLHLADLYHEIAHILLEQKQTRLWEDFSEQIRNYFEREHKKGILEQSPLASRGVYMGLADSWLNRWSIEFTCDMIATYLCGPAYGWSHLHLCASKESPDSIYHPNVGEDADHPASHARFIAIGYVLDDMGLHTDKVKIEEKWNALVQSLSLAKPIHFQAAYPEKLIADLQLQIKNGLIALGIQVYAPADPLQRDTETVSYVLNQAWGAFWEKPKDYPDWEATALAKLKLV